MKKFFFFLSSRSCKTVIVLLMHLMPISCLATNWYFSTTDGNDSRTSSQAQNSSTPWQTSLHFTDALSAATTGDSILFKRGDLFSGFSISSCNSGITFGAYGGGNAPILSGLQTLSSWTNVGTNLWEASCNSGLNLDLVLVGGVTVAVGRSPNTGSYYNIDSYTNVSGSSGTITSSSTNASTQNWVGAEAVIRVNQYNLDRDIISAHSGTTLTYSTPSNGNSIDGGGHKFFIQKHPATLDAQNEWYYNAGTHVLRMFSTTNPSSLNVQAATKDYFYYVNFRNHISFQNIQFTGYDSCVIEGRILNYFTVNNCKFQDIGIAGICIDTDTSGVYTNNTVKRVGNNGIEVRIASHTTVSGNNIDSCGLIPGMGLPNNQQLDGIKVEAAIPLADSITITDNIVKNVGYCGIRWTGRDAQILRNYVDNFGLIDADGGGIYTNGDNGLAHMRIVADNVVLNGHGNHDMYNTTGDDGEPGIYLDDLTGDVSLLRNTIKNATRFGIFLHNPKDIIVRDNTIFGTTSPTGAAAIGIEQDSLHPELPTRGISVSRNLINSPTGVYMIRVASLYNDLNSIGTIDTNYYSRTEDGNLFQVAYGGNTQYTLSSWRANTPYDDLSTFQVIPSDSLRFDVNPTGSAINVSLPSSYLDLKGTSYSGTITLQPHTSLILRKQPSVPGSLYRIHAGGSAISTSLGNFAADAYYSPTPGNTASVSTAIAGTTDDALYQTERFSSSGQMQYKFPVINGQYKVVLHFAETFWGEGGRRKFDVKIEDSLRLNDYDIAAKVGPNTATFEKFNVNVTDDTLNIAFDSRTIVGGADEAKVDGIEVIPIVYRINSGGGQVSDSIGIFAADTLYAPSPGNTSTGATVTGTTSPDIYSDDRWGSSGQIHYALPVANGDYTVILHFAETFFGSAGQRVFDVNMESVNKLSNYDIYTAAGGSNKAKQEVFQVSVSDGVLNIDFSSLSGVNEPSIRAIEVLQKIVTTEANSSKQVSSIIATAEDPGTKLQKLSVKALPNPSSGNFTLAVLSATNKPLTVKVYNAIGLLVESRQHIASSTLQLGQNYKPGLYFVELTEGTEKVTLKVIKQ